MKRCQMATVILIVVVVVLSAVVWTRYADSLNAIKHDTNRWAVIEDVNGDRMAVEPPRTLTHVWSQLVLLGQNGTRMLIGGIIERYSNKWGFRFQPNSVTVAQVTAEGLQATIRDISADLNYWLSLNWVYVSAKVVEVHLEV